MRSARRMGRRRILGNVRAATAARMVLVALIVGSTRAELPLSRPRGSASGGKGAYGLSAPRPDSVHAIADVALRPDGVLEGQVASATNGLPAQTLAGLPVSVLRGPQSIATTITDAHGRFSVPDLPGGLYRVVVETPREPSWRFYRVWTSAGAPPHAADRASMPIGEDLVRGQSPLPVPSASQAATIAALAAGAIAAPIVYHGVKQDDVIRSTPASP